MTLNLGASKQTFCYWCPNRQTAKGKKNKVVGALKTSINGKITERTKVS